MPFLALALSAAVLASDTTILIDRIDRFDPVSGAHTGTQRSWFDPDGRRLREEVTDAAGNRELVFLVLHDVDGRESGAVYFEGDSDEPTREAYTYSLDGLVKTAVYFYEPGVGSDRNVVELDEKGREVAKRYYRGDGTQYGEEEVLWDERGNQEGWDFRYTDREGGASFRYRYQAFDEAGRWTRRTMHRDGAPMRVEARSLVTTGSGTGSVASVPFLPGIISTDSAEASPSFSADGKVMAFARYGDDWYEKDPYIAYLEEAGWRVEPIPEIGPVYNLAIAPDGSALIFSTRSGDGSPELFRTGRSAEGWSAPENLTDRYGIVGTYPSLTTAGDLFLFDSDGPEGSGIYVARKVGDGFGTTEPIYTPDGGTTFDAYAESLSGSLLVSRCVDDICDSNGMNGIWEVELEDGVVSSAGKVESLPYAWGIQPVESLGLMVFTDGEDILAVPLSEANRGRPSHRIQERSSGFDFLLGSWEGSLEYLDYGDDETLVTLPTGLACRRSDDGSALILDFSFAEPDGRRVISTDRLFETEEGVNLGGWWQVSERSQDPAAGIYRLELAQDGEDNGREASVRTLVVVEGAQLTITKFVRYAGSTEELQRHQYRLARTEG